MASSDLNRSPDYRRRQGLQPVSFGRHRRALSRTSQTHNHVDTQVNASPSVTYTQIQHTSVRDEPLCQDELESSLPRRRPDGVCDPLQGAGMPLLPVTLYAQEQDTIMTQMNDQLSQCVYDFIINHRFPIPVEPGKIPIRSPRDRGWSEWVYLLKRLAIKRRIPAHLIHDGRIKQLTTILENSLNTWHLEEHDDRPLRDDRNVLQCISSALQVTKTLKDVAAMRYLDALYVRTEQLIHTRRYPASMAVYTGNYSTF